MKVQVDEITSVKKSLTVEIPQEIVSKAFSDAYSDLNNRVKVPGFRSGKVPVSLLEKKYGPSVKDDIVRKLIPDYYQKAVEQTGISPVAFPSFEKVEAKKGASLFFTATVEVKPSFTLKEYDNIVLPREEIKVTEADIDQALSARQEEAGQLEVCPDDHEIASLDFAVINFEGTLNGEPVKEGKQEGYTIQIGSNTFPSPFESELLGKKKGDAVAIGVPYPEDFQNKAIAGKQVHFQVEIQEIKKKVLPLLDDEFAKDLGHDTLEVLKMETKETLLKDAASKAEHHQKKRLIEKLIELNPFEIPSSLVVHELNTILGSFPDQEALGKDSDKQNALIKELEPLARTRVAESLILSQVAEKEKVDVTDAEIERELESIAKGRGTPLQETKRAFYQKEGAMQGLKAQLKENKALALIYTKVRFEAVPENKPDVVKGEKS